MREAMERGKAAPGEVALLEDKILLDQSGRQRYGSQLKFNALNNTYELYPIEDEAFVNDRREEMGLSPLEDYLRPWGVQYTPPK